MENRLFRGRFKTIKDNSEWAIGFLFEKQEEGCSTSLCIADKPLYCYGGGFDEISENCYASVEPATVGLCTNLKETYVNGEYTDGDLLFIGDIISIITYSYTEPEGGYYGKIEMDSFGFYLLMVDAKGNVAREYLSNLQGSYITHYTKHGNVHDNPELMGKQ